MPKRNRVIMAVSRAQSCNMDYRDGRSLHAWRRTFVTRPAWCKLCPTPRSCDARIVQVLNEAEYRNDNIRLSVHECALSLGWGECAFYGKLLDGLRDAHVHFTDVTGQIFDLDLSPLETPLDGFEVDPETEMETLRTWIGDTILRQFTAETLPVLRGVGKARFIVIASALIALNPELEAKLCEITDRDFQDRFGE